MLISVIIPTCHRNDLLARCLDRLAPGAQNLPADQYEVIVTDDGTNSTAEMLCREKFPWVIWKVGPRRGPAANRNSGASFASGLWLAFTDDDCVPSDEWLSEYVREIHSGSVVLEGRTTCVDGVTSPLQHAPINQNGGYLWSCNMLIQAEAFSRFRFDETYPYPHMEDVDLRERLINALIVPRFVPGAVVDHPPRPIPPAFRRAAFHQCEILYFWRKRGHFPSRWKNVYKLVRCRMIQIQNRKLSLDSIRAAMSSAYEIFLVAWYFKSWCLEIKRREYRAGI